MQYSCSNIINCSHLNKDAIQHVGKAPLPLRRKDVQAEAFDIRSSVGDGAEQVAGVQA